MISEVFPFLKDKPEAYTFLCYYYNYVHAIDDLIDEAFTPELLFKVLHLSSLIYSSNYFVSHRDSLLAIDHLIANLYADSVLFEKSGDEKKKDYADKVRHCGFEMIMAVLKIELGWEAIRVISPNIREKIFTK